MEEVWTEIDALRSIFEDDLIVDDSDRNSVILKKKVRPSDCENKSSASVVVHFTLNEKYPERSPRIQLSNSRGISETDHTRLEEEVRQRLEQNIGMPVIFDILQLCSDFLLENQHSSAMLCPICLDSLAHDDVTATPCEHYIHKRCMSDYTHHTRQQISKSLQDLPPHMHNQIEKSLLCPVCREIVEDELEPLGSNSKQKKKERKENEKTGGNAEKFDFNWSKWKEEQAKMKELFEKQREKGGIIDPEEERKKNLITEDTVVVIPANQPTEEEHVEPSSNTTNKPASSRNATKTTSDHTKTGRRDQRTHCTHGGNYRNRGYYKEREQKHPTTNNKTTTTRGNRRGEGQKQPTSVDKREGQKQSTSADNI